MKNVTLLCHLALVRLATSSALAEELIPKLLDIQMRLYVHVAVKHTLREPENRYIISIEEESCKQRAFYAEQREVNDP